MFAPGFYRCSGLPPHKLSLLEWPPRKRLGSGRFCGTGLGFSVRNDTPILSLNVILSPELGSRRIYSTSFFCFSIKAFTIYRSCKVGVPFAPREQLRKPLHRPQGPDLTRWRKPVLRCRAF